MELPLSPDAIAALPKPDEQGLIRVQATLKLNGDGEVELQDINGTPVGSSNDDENPMPSKDLPNLDQSTASFAS